MKRRSAKSLRLAPPLADWFAARFPNGPSAIQKQALPHTLAGSNTLILAPTGSGKTLAAFLSVFSDLITQAGAGALPNAVRAVYVSPLRSLTRDMLRNLSDLAAQFDIRLETRTGDTDSSDRQRQQRRPPHILLTTPESLSAILSQKGFAEGLHPRTVIVDEIHAFAESKRGSLLSLTLERLETRAAPEGLQRIGLSATAWPVEAATRLLCGQRDCAVASLDLRKAHRLEISPLREDTVLPAAGFSPYRIAYAVADHIAAANCTLIFTATRSAAERLGLALKIILPQWEDQIEVHHASVDRANRLRIEDALAAGAIKAAVCSTSLELGLDFAAVDQVLLIGAPRGVSRAVQRLGRSGHRVDGVASGVLVPLSLPDMLECIALRRAAQDARLDAQRPPEAPLDVLAQALLGMSIERPWSTDDAYELVRRAGPYLNLSHADFTAVLDYLAGGGKVLGGYQAEPAPLPLPPPLREPGAFPALPALPPRPPQGPQYGKILIADGSFRVASQKVARQYYLNIGTISDDYAVKVVTKNNHRLGEVEETFLASLPPGEGFVIGGKAVVVKRLHGDTAVVEAAQGERLHTPRWMGSKMSLTARLAQEERDLRRGLRDAWSAGQSKACADYLRSTWRVNPEIAARTAEYVRRQTQAAPIPIDSPVQLERVKRGRTQLLIFHVIAGRAVNRSLAWVLGRRLGENIGSVVSNFIDQGFVLSLNARNAPDTDRLRAGFDPQNFRETLREALETTETLGRRFRPIAETGQLLARRTTKGPVGRRMSSWNGALLYQTFLKYEPDHPLVRETIREVMQDDLDIDAAHLEAARIFNAEWEIFDLPRPSPFALPLFALFNKEIVLAQDPDKALDELVQDLYQDWA